MLDAKLLRQNPERVKEALTRRNESEETWNLFHRFATLDREWREFTAQVETLRARRNAMSQEVAVRKKNREDASDLIEETRLIGDQIKELDDKIRGLDEEIEFILMRLPNLPHESVPYGKSEEDNPEIRRYGAIPNFAFEPKPHWEIGQNLGILDFERASKVTGSRFVFYIGLGARLERALLNFMMDIQTSENGYVEVWPPYLVNRTSMVGTGNLPKFEEDVFRIDDLDYFLIPTAEVPVTNLHRDEILLGNALPIKYAGFSASFRSEAGAAGRDTRGLIRLHQFNKVELVKFVAPETSYQELELIVHDAEVVLQRLQLPYRVIEICTGDLGFKETKKYDLEVWLPSANMYREISSCSNFEDFQARRANLRFRRTEKAKPEFVHTLNGSGLALGRTVAAILENYQEADGSVRIPEVLRPYLGGIERISPVVT
ncbi:serine--tRNA ligase [Sulfoacidibacillus thermotolerans]|uniref:Serine--tRNA ligase n=1 Tax=Sulfoacidibacillus thermotolerans TaxID=1765684 RepID=A0A2U3D2Y6_SULT2|nr:serine--tRNA ligase [Sulfoacidibacillus thermotolerans]PWI55629.1 serine--tRNA ligase [Sulfoacidibacillus thermotolerans]